MLNEPSLARSASVVVLGLPDPHGARLGRVIEDRLGIPCAVMATLSSLDPTTWVVTTPTWVGRLLDSSIAPDHLAILWGDRPGEGHSARWVQQGVTILTGPMPRTVLDWLQSTALVPADPWTWEDPDDRPPTFTWEDEADAAPVIPSLPRAAPRSSPAAQGLSLAVYSSGGGVGKTTTAVYLATIASRRRLPTGIVELDENRSGLLTYWDRKAPHGGLDSVKPGDWSDPGRLAARLATMAIGVAPRLMALSIVGTSEGLQYHPEDAARDLGHLYAWARHQWAVTFYDLPATVRDEGVYHTLQAVDRVLFVLEPTEIMLESSLRYLRIIEGLGPVGHDMIRKMGLVVNKVPKSRQARLDPLLLAETLALPLWGQIPENTVRYMAGINQHKIGVTPDWEKLWAALALPVGDAALAVKASDPARRGGWLFRKKEA